MGTLAFSGQIFSDFAGYTTTAIGCALALGFSLPDNFRYPYAAIGFSDFWRRWHISLSTWLRDYLYVPLGGNRLANGEELDNFFDHLARDLESKVVQSVFHDLLQVSTRRIAGTTTSEPTNGSGPPRPGDGRMGRASLRHGPCIRQGPTPILLSGPATTSRSPTPRGRRSAISAWRPTAGLRNAAAVIWRVT